LQFLQNRTDGQLAEILESIRAANYRRFMAINVVYSSLPKALTSSNVLGMLQVGKQLRLRCACCSCLHKSKQQAPDAILV
jgi:hypothetical protein